MARRPKSKALRMRSTTVVLWLMILLVFLPIVAVHIAARFIAPEPEPAEAVR